MTLSSREAGIISALLPIDDIREESEYATSEGKFIHTSIE